MSSASNNNQTTTPCNDINSERRAAMAVFARATTQELEDGLRAADCDLAYRDLRAPEVGLVMARARISGTGSPFNLGEVSVTRAAVRLTDDATGFAYLLGRDPPRARLAAIADAYWQDSGTRPRIEAQILQPVRTRVAREKAQRRSEVAATQVDFFTVVRGDD